MRRAEESAAAVRRRETLLYLATRLNANANNLLLMP